MSAPQVFRAAAAQYAPVFLNRTATLDKACDLMRVSSASRATGSPGLLLGLPLARALSFHWSLIVSSGATLVLWLAGGYVAPQRTAFVTEQVIEVV